MRRPLSCDAWLRLSATAASAVLVALAFASPAAGASPPALIRDVNPSGDGNPTGLTRVGGRVFFAAYDGAHGTELWKSDGTDGGTVLLSDIKPGYPSSRPGWLTDVNGTLFFVAADRAHGQEVWKSDGTAAGTVLVKNIASRRHGSLPRQLTAVEDRLFFIAERYGAAPEVWVSDGTAAGTKSVYAPTASGHQPSRGVAVGDRFYFVTTLGTDNVAQLWWTDGTTTKRVKAISGIDVGQDWEGHVAMAAVGSRLFLAVDDALWRTNGSAGGTRKLLDGDFATGPSLMHALGSKLVFLRGANHNELWKSDGTKAGTKQIYNIGASPLQGASMVTATGQVFIARGYDALSPSGYGSLWRTNGTNLGTQHVGPGSFAGRPAMLTTVDDALCFAVPDWDPNGFTWALWETDGTSASEGTYSVASFVLPWEGVEPAAALNGALIFAANDGVHGAELWSYTP